jgi:hypothetical protein
MPQEQELKSAAAKRNLNFKGCNKCSRDILEKLMAPQLFKHFLIPRHDIVRQ